MKAPKFLRSLACLVICLAMLLQPMTVLATGTTPAELIVNGTFADADGDGKADGWSYYIGSAVECPSTLGEDGITINADSSDAAQRLTVHQTVSGLDSAKTYRLTGRYNVTSTAKGSLEIRYSVDGANPATRTAYQTSKTDGWQTFDVTFTGGSNVKFEIVVSQGATLTCSVDDISLTEVVTEEESDELMVNGTFADADGDGLADGWSYWNGTYVAAASSVDEDGLHITANSSGDKQRLTVHQTVSDLIPGTTYKFSGRYIVHSTGYGSLEIRYGINGSNTTVAVHTAVTDGWLTFNEEILLPEGAESIKFEIVVSPGATLTCSLNDFSLVVAKEAEVPEVVNLVQNPTYETTDISAVPSWNYYPAYAANAGTNYEASTADGVFTGTVLGGSNLILHQTMPLAGDQLNKTYTFTGDIKTEDLSSYAMFKVYIQDASGKQLSSFLSGQVKGTTDWTPISLEFEVPDSVGGVDVASIKLEQYILKGTGTAHFRNPSIIKTGDYVTLPEGDPIDTLVKNGGYRWAFDFGKEDYNLTGYWEIAEGGTRWNYYRKNALGHNTLVINPENGANQTVGAYAGAIEQSINNPGGGYTILDMTDAYQKNAVDVKRGFAYFDRLQVLIRDEYTLKEIGDVYWQMHTEADVTVSADGKTATLTQGGETVLLKLIDENGTDLKFQTMAAAPYEGLKTYDGENVNEGVTKIFVAAEGVQTGVINVLITPDGLEDPAVKALDNWDEYDFSTLTEEDEPIASPVITASNVAKTGKVRLTWDAVEGAVQYKVYRATSKTGTYKLMYTTSGTSYTNTNAGKYYYYYVVAVAEDGTESEASNIAGRTCDLARPVVTASNVAKTGKVRLTWNAVEGAVEYKIYRSTEKDGKYSLMYTTANTSYINTKAEAGVTYYYKVVAVAAKTAGNSAAAQVSRTCDLPQTKLTGKLNLFGTPKLTWEKVDGAVKYKVYRAASENGSYKLMKTTTGTSYTNTNHVDGTTYYYYVVAVAENTWANSAASNVVKLTAK